MNRKLNNALKGRNAEATVLTMFNKWSGGQFRRSGYGQKGGDIILKAESTWNWPYVIEVKSMEHRPEQVNKVFLEECDAKRYVYEDTFFIYRYRGQIWVAFLDIMGRRLFSIYGGFGLSNLVWEHVDYSIAMMPLKDLLDWMEDPAEHFGGEK